MRGWIYLLDPSCCLPLTMPDCFRIATDPLSVVDALRSFSLPPCSSCARHTLRLRGLRATCHLTLRLPFRSLHRPMHPFLASRTCPCALPGIRFSRPPRPLSAPSLVSSLSWPSVRFPPQSCPLCSLSALPFVRPASCPVRLLSVPCPLYPSTSFFRIPHVACAISQPDSHLISSMVLVLCPFPVRASLVCWWLDLFVVGECSIDQVHPL